MDVWFTYVVLVLCPLIWFAINFMIVPGMLVCSSFLITQCIFIVSKALLISSATIIVRAEGAIWLNPLLRYYLMCVVPSL